MSTHCHYTSLTRISPLQEVDWRVDRLPLEAWATGDYILCEAEVRGHDLLELDTGRMARVASGDLFIGALGEREATLEATGSWRDVDADRALDVLTSAGLLGKLRSKSTYLPTLIRATYRGHVIVGGEKATMERFVDAVEARRFETPSILMVGTSMSAGKTTAGQTVVRRLKHLGRRVVAAKLTGAGRFRDILHMRDAGADWIYDFVDAGLPSTVAEPDTYRAVLKRLLSAVASRDADVAVIEIGASPLAAYNGMIALEMIRESVRLTLLAASDVYAVRGFEQMVGMRPDLIVGPAVNTSAGVDLVARHAGLPGLDLSAPSSLPRLDNMLRAALERG